jgi:hypothetical protein
MWHRRGIWNEFIFLIMLSNVGCCEHGNEYESIKFGEFID